MHEWLAIFYFAWETRQMRELVEWELSSLSLGQAPSLNPVQIIPPVHNVPSSLYPTLSPSLSPLPHLLLLVLSCHCSRNVPRCCHDGVTSNILWLSIPKWTDFIERMARNRCRFIDYKSVRNLRSTLFPRRLLKQRDVPDVCYSQLIGALMNTLMNASDFFWIKSIRDRELSQDVL